MHTPTLPNRGQWLSEDPLVITKPETFLLDPQQLNAYSYVGNNPINRIDPTGLYSLNQFFNDAAYTYNPLNALFGAPSAQIAYGIQTKQPGQVVQGAGNVIVNTALVVGTALDLGATGAGIYQAVQDNAALQNELLNNTTTNLPQVLQNKANGDAFRDQVANQLEQDGRAVQKEVVKPTIFGPRRIDIEVKDNQGNVLGGVETKLNNSPYTASQRAKDAYLKYTSGYQVNVIRGTNENIKK